MPRVASITIFGAFLAVGCFAQTPWTTTSAFLTSNANLSFNPPSVAGPNGDLYIGAMAGVAQPTGKFGDVSQGFQWISRINPTGMPVFADWIGGARETQAVGVTASGNGLIAGLASASGLPATTGAWASSSSGNFPSFVCEVAANDGTPLFCTYLNGAIITAIGTDAAGDIYVLANPNGPPAITATSGALSLGATTFVMKLNATGSSLLWIAGIDFKATAMTVDAAGEVFLAGGPGPGNPPGTIFVQKIDGSGSKLISRLPVASASRGTLGDPVAIAIDNSGATYVTGDVNGGSYAMKVSADGSRVVYLTPLPLNSNNQRLLGGGAANDIAADANGNAMITGYTSNLVPHVLTATCRQTNLRYPAPQGGSREAYVVRLGQDGSVLQSTYIGTGSAPLLAFGITSAGDHAYVTVATSDTSKAGVLEIGPDTTGSSATSIGCMTNAATFAAGMLAPGEIFSIFGEGLGPAQGAAVPLGADGRFPSDFAGVRVTFDDAPAPLLYVQDGQINAITPWELVGKTSTRMCAVYLTHTSCTTAAFGQAAPGFFVLKDGSAVVNQDGTLNSAANPAPSGSIVTMYGTGLGPLSAAQADGSLTQLPLPSLVYPVQVTFQQTGTAGPGFDPTLYTGEVVYAGPAPLEVSGFFQINVRVPKWDSVSGGALRTVTVEVQLPDGSTVATTTQISSSSN